MPSISQEVCEAILDDYRDRLGNLYALEALVFPKMADFYETLHPRQITA